MRHVANYKILLLASLVLGAMLAVYAAQTARPRLADTGQGEKTNDWKSKLTNEERDLLSRSESPNDHVKTYLRLAEQRLKNIRDLANREDFTAAGEQIIGYTALIAEAGNYTKTSVQKRDKAHKTLETALREQIRTLDGIRHDVSSKQAELIDEALKIVNQVRRQSLNLLLGDGGILSETGKP